MNLAVILAFAVLMPLAASHSSLIKPKPRNAIDSELPEWKDGNAPYMWVNGIGKDGAPCACRNGTDVCAPAQTCLWFSVGCTIGCAECDGGDKGPSNPNRQDRCGSGMKATINDPKHRTINRAAEAGSEQDWTKFNPWRAPGHAPVYDPCGRASGSYKATPGKGEFTDTKYAKQNHLIKKKRMVVIRTPRHKNSFAVYICVWIPPNLLCGCAYIKYIDDTAKRVLCFMLLVVISQLVSYKHVCK